MAVCTYKICDSCVHIYSLWSLWAQLETVMIVCNLRPVIAVNTHIICDRCVHI